MSIKLKLIELLETEPQEYLSGSFIAEKLGVTRAAVWKSIQQLQEDGYVIDAVQNRGYRLGALNDMLSATTIKKYLGDKADVFSLEVYDNVTSTNTLLKEKAAALPEWHTIIAGAQSAGRGRLGRSFLSPSGTGVYISILMRPDMQAFEATRITTAAAVAVCRAIEDLSSVKPEIKWVNDVFVNGKKVCGILTEASFSMESGTMEYVIPGIGINVYEPEGGFPPELQNIAGAIFTTRERDLRSRLTASFLGHFYDIASSLDGGYIDEYRSRSFLIGKRITVIRGQNRTPALALDVDDSCHLVVRYDDGTVEALSSGEVSVRPEDTPC